jgi:hypothetical protein
MKTIKEVYCEDIKAYCLKKTLIGIKLSDVTSPLISM